MNVKCCISWKLYFTEHYFLELKWSKTLNLDLIDPTV